MHDSFTGIDRRRDSDRARGEACLSQSQQCRESAGYNNRVLLSIETSALNRAAKTHDGLVVLRQIMDAERLRPAVGTHTIYELAKMLWDDRHTETRCRLFQLIVDLDPAFLLPADRLLELEVSRLLRGESVIPFLMGSDLEVTRRTVARLASAASDEEAIEFTRRREQAIDRARLEDRENVERIQHARREGLVPDCQDFDQFCAQHSADIPELIERRFGGRIDAHDASRFAARLDEFPGLRTTVRADLHFMFIRVVQGKVPSRDKTGDYRHVIDASYCAGILVDDRKLLRKVPVLNPQLRAIAWRVDTDGSSRRDGATLSRGRGASVETSGDVPRGSTVAGRQDRPGSVTRTVSNPQFDCIYCRSTVLPTKREHVISQALGTFEQNWTLDCVCDECNEYFANSLELALGRDSREALLRIELGLKPTTGASELLNRRIKTSLQDPGQFHGIRVLMVPSDDGADVEPIPIPQVGFRREDEDWCFLTERELTPDGLERFQGSSPVQIKICGIGEDCQRLRRRLAELGIEFSETHRLLDQPITEQSSISVLYDIHNDETVVRAACKIGFNYAAKVLGCETVRRSDFDAARRFVRYGEEPVRLATAQQQSILVGQDAETARVHACGIGWDRGYLCVVVSLFNELTYALRLCRAGEFEFAATQHVFDPWSRRISEITVEG